MASAERSIIVDVTPEKFYEVITDFSKYPNFLKEVKKIEVLDKGENTWKVLNGINLIKSIEYTLDFVGEPGKSLKWKLADKGFMKKNDGAWTLKDLGDGRTEATYTLDIELGIFAPKAIVNKVMEVNFPSMLKAFKKQAESL